RSINAASSALAAAMAARNRVDSSSTLPCRPEAARTASASSTSGPRARPGETGVPRKQTIELVSLSIARHVGEIAFNQLDQCAHRLVRIAAFGQEMQGRHGGR